MSSALLAPIKTKIFQNVPRIPIKIQGISQPTHANILFISYNLKQKIERNIVWCKKYKRN